MGGTNEGAENRAGWLASNQGVAVCILGVVIVLMIYLLSSDWVYEELRDGFRLGYFSLFGAFTMLVCTAGMIVDGRRHEVEPELAQMRKRDWLYAFVALGNCFIYFQLAWKIDFLLVTPVFMAGATYILGVRPVWSAIMIGVVVTGVIYTLLYLIGIRLPSEILPSIGGMFS